jgi:hypothetical protein
VWLQEVVQHEWDPRLESQPHMKWAMESPVVTVLNTGETLILGKNMLIVVHVKDVHSHMFNELCLPINLGVEKSGFSEIGVQ